MNRLPAALRAYHFQELSCVLPTCVAYEHEDEFWWNVAHIHDRLSEALDGQIEKMGVFTSNSQKTLDDKQSIKEKLGGESVYVRPWNDRWGVDWTDQNCFIKSVITGLY